MSELCVRVAKAMQFKRSPLCAKENDVVKWGFLATLHPYLLSVGYRQCLDNYQFPSIDAELFPVALPASCSYARRSGKKTTNKSR